MKATYLKITILAGGLFIALASCEDKKETPTPEEPEPTPTAPCFNSNNNGTYTAAIGSIQSGTAVTSFTGGVVTINRTSCHDVEFHLTTSVGYKIEAITNVIVNSNGIYDGNVSTGSMTMAFGSHLNAEAPGSFTVIAQK